MTQCLTLTALWSTHAHVFKRCVVNVHSKWDFPFIFCFIKWRQSFLHAIYYFVNDCTNNYYHLWHKTWNVGLCFIFTVKQHMPLNFNQKCLKCVKLCVKIIYPFHVHLCIHIKRGCVYIPHVKHSTVYWPMFVQHMIFSCWRLCLAISQRWRFCMSTFRKRIYTAYSSACAVVIKIIKIKIDKCKDFQLSLTLLFSMLYH